jgi:hypothetical protein
MLEIGMITQDLTKGTTIEETLELLVEETNIQTHANIEPPFPHEEPQISLQALSGILTPQTLKLIGYIKHHKFIVDSGSTHNFIHKRVEK